jgi:hypothetical protein
MVGLLMSRGISQERAERMDYAEAKAWVIIMGEIPRAGERRMTWDWLNDRWAADS